MAASSATASPLTVRTVVGSGIDGGGTGIVIDSTGNRTGNGNSIDNAIDNGIAAMHLRPVTESIDGRVNSIIDADSAEAVLEERAETYRLHLQQLQTIVESLADHGTGLLALQQEQARELYQTGASSSATVDVSSNGWATLVDMPANSSAAPTAPPTTLSTTIKSAPPTTNTNIMSNLSPHTLRPRPTTASSGASARGRPRSTLSSAIDVMEQVDFKGQTLALLFAKAHRCLSEAQAVLGVRELTGSMSSGRVSPMAIADVVESKKAGANANSSGNVGMDSTASTTARPTPLRSMPSVPELKTTPSLVVPGGGTTLDRPTHRKHGHHYRRSDTQELVALIRGDNDNITAGASAVTPLVVDSPGAFIMQPLALDVMLLSSKQFRVTILSSPFVVPKIGALVASAASATVGTTVIANPGALDVPPPQTAVIITPASPAAPPNTVNVPATTSTIPFERTPLIPLSPVVTAHQTVALQLERATERLHQLEHNSSASTATTAQLAEHTLHLQRRLHSLAAQLHHAQRLSVTAMHADQLAFAITLVDWSIMSRIRPKEDLLEFVMAGTREQRAASAAVERPAAMARDVSGSSDGGLLRAHPGVTASTDFFNYLTRAIEHIILDASDSTARAHHIRHAIKIARTLHQLRNFNSLKAVVTALRTPPIARLKRSWAQVPRKYQVALDELRTLVSEDENYARYRSAIGNAVRPAVPFLGVILHDLTYAVASNKLVLERRRTEEAGGAGGGRDLDSAAGSSTMPIDNDALLASLLHEPGETSTVGYSSGHVRSVLFSFEYFQCGPTYDDDARFGQCGSRQHSQGFTRKLMGGGSGGGGGDVYHSASDMRGHYRDHSHHGQTAHSSSSTTGTSTPATSATNARTPGPEDLACDRAFCLHWLLTRPYIPSRAIDDLSRKREPPRTSVTSINAVLLREDKDRPTTASSNGSVEQLSQSRSSSPRSMSLSTMASSPTRQHLSVDNLAVPGSSGFLFPPPPPLPSSASMADVSISRSPRKVGQPTSIVKPSSGSRVNKLLHVIGLEVERRDDGKRTVRRAKAASMDALAEKGQQQQQHFGEEVRGGECDDDDDDAYGIAGGSSDGASPTKSPGSE